MGRQGRGIGQGGSRGGSEYVQNELSKIPNEQIIIDFKSNIKKERKKEQV